MKRATYRAARSADMMSNFNPRPREEGDLLKGGYNELTTNFNPRPREEGDIIQGQKF